MYKAIFTPLLVLLTVITQAQQFNVIAIDTDGSKLSAFYRSLDVEHLWLKGYHVNWETGIADRNDNASNKKTHCSRFVAAGCKRLNIYILRPPECANHLMANAQYDWLMTNEAKKDGWEPIKNDDIFDEYYLAQQYADKGYVTVAVYKNDNPEKSGHIAFVTPTRMTYDEIRNGGPMLTQAGHFNANATPLRKGFENHIKTWPEKKILFYYNKDRSTIE